MEASDGTTSGERSSAAALLKSRAIRWRLEGWPVGDGRRGADDRTERKISDKRDQGRGVDTAEVMVGTSALTVGLPYETLLGELLELPLKDSVREKWLWQNAARLFGVACTSKISGSPGMPRWRFAGWTCNGPNALPNALCSSRVSD